MPSNKEKVYMYPYLCDYMDDYNKTNFEIVESHQYIIGGKVKFDVSYNINNDRINQMIIDNTIRVCCYIKCAELARVVTKTFNPNSNSISIEIDSMDLSGNTNIICYLIANDDFVFEDEDFSKDWQGEKCYIEKNNALGESNIIKVSISHKTDSGRNSIFSFVCAANLNPGDPYELSLSGDRIVFRLSAEDYTIYNAIQQKSATLVVSGALMNAFSAILGQMIEKNYDEDDDDFEWNAFNTKYRTKKWYKALCNKYFDLFGVYPYEGKIDVFTAVQKLLNEPIAKTFEYGKMMQNKTTLGEE